MATAQRGVDAVLKEIEASNTTLNALREQTEAQKLENRTGIYLAGPEISYARLWGNPGGIGRRTDLSVTQTFDIPTLTGMKSRMAAGQNSLAGLQYRSERMALLLKARVYCLELIYCNALYRELSVRLGHAAAIAEGYKTRLEQGDISRPEYNKVLLNLAAAEGEFRRVEVERDALRAELKRLNGGTEISLEDDRYGEVAFPPDFDGWYARVEQQYPALACARQETALSRQQVSLNKAANLPVFSAGYMSEKVVGQQYQGLTLGVSIPLWENKNRVRQARAAVRAAESRQADREEQFRNRLQALYSRAAGLRLTAEGYRRALDASNHTELLKKALDAGEISLLDYLVETGLYYDAIRRTLETERDFQIAFAELSAVDSDKWLMVNG
ncbi:MAG: TolC family protein [Tannerella sp.]|jgi:outer membrane protein TolC|nr:TolC family protein [Tannerella sp.]